jgi:salicylate hydroxylase
MDDLKVLVAGGGIGGITAALCLADRGFRVAVFEQSAEFGEVGAGIQLSPNCTRVLHHLGLEDALRARAFLPEGTRFRNWRTGKVITESVLGDRLLEQYGMPYYHIHRGDLLRVLVDAAQRNPGITLHADARVEQMTQDGRGVSFTAGGSVHEGDLAVGADGIHSVIRSALWGEELPRFTGNVAWRALVPVERLPEGLVPPMATVWWGPHKHFVHYYVRGGALLNCVCVVEKKGWEVESWTERGDYQELKSDFAGWHEDVQLLIDNADRDSLFKWALYDRAPMSRWGQGRVTLLGDACHPTPRVLPWPSRTRLCWPECWRPSTRSRQAWRVTKISGGRARRAFRTAPAATPQSVTSPVSGPGCATGPPARPGIGPWNDSTVTTRWKWPTPELVGNRGRTA